MQPQRHRGTEALLDSAWPLCSLCLCGLILLLINNTGNAWPITVPNAGFEQIDSHGILLGWQHVTYWSDSHFHLETADAHSGHYAIRIDGAPHAQGYLRLRDPIEVSPGEILEAGAWVKIKNVPANQSAVIAAEFTNTDGQTGQFARFVNIRGDSPAKNGWIYVHGTITAPAMAASMRLRLGFWDGQGSVWFDDVQLISHTAVGCRIDMPWGELLPSSPYLRVRIIHRDGANADLVRAMFNGRTIKTSTSDSEISTKIIPLDPPSPGIFPLRVEIRDRRERSVASDARMLTVPPPMRISPPIPTHWAVEDGPPRVQGDINLALTKNDFRSSTLEIRLLDSSGNTQARWMPDVQSPLESAMHYQLQASPLPAGNYTITADLRRRDQGSIHLQQPFHVLPRRLESSSVNAGGYIVYDRTAVFPLGIFNGDAHLSEFKDAGFTVTHAYNACDVIEGQDPYDRDMAAQKFLDDTERASLKAIFLIPRDYVFHHDWPAFRRRIQMFRNHPALVAWDEEEGIARGDMSPDDLKKMVQIIHQEDPHHPILIGDSHDEIEKIKDRSHFFPADQMDLGMWWWYPFPLQNRTSLLNGDEGPSTSELIPPVFLTANTTGKPIWLGVQAYDKQGEDPAFKTARYPTPAEYRAQAFISIIAGAKGLMWYGGSVAGGIYEDPNAGHWNDLKKLVAELHDMIPVFLSPTASAPSFDPPAAPISVMRKHTPSGDVLFAANRAAQFVDVTFHLGAKNMSAHFEPYAVQVYRLP